MSAHQLAEFYLMNVICTDWGTAPHPPAIQEAVGEARRLNPNLVDLRTYLARHLGISGAGHQQAA